MTRFTLFSILLATLLTAGRAAPSASPDPEAKATFLETRDWITDCYESSFENQSSGGSPRVDDCLQIVRNIAGGGTWNVPLAGQHQLVQYGTSAFGVSPGWVFGYTNITVGNSDISDLINDSVRRFQWNGLVGAKGVMGCQGDPYGGWISTEWGLYHT